MTNPDHLQFTVAILWCMVGFGSYYLLGRSLWLAGKFETSCKYLDKQGNQVLLQRALGLLFLGLLSALIILFLPQKHIWDFGLGFHFTQLPPWWCWLLLLPILYLSYKTAQTPHNLKHYPQMRANAWTVPMLIISGLSWLVFLLGYEFLFRGFVLFASLSIMEPVPAIALNTALYVFAHFYKGPAEIFGTIPAGILLSYLTVVTGNIWSAVVLHSIMALSNEWFSLKAHPEMSVQKAP